MVSKRSTVTVLSACGMALLAAGCVETTAQSVPKPELPPRSNMARRDGVSPHGASVAIAAVQGVSASVSDRLAHAFEQAAGAREVNLTDAKAANYLVRGYLNTSPVEGGTSFAVVWDVYDAKKRRTQRIDDRVFVKGGMTAEQIDDQTLAQIAALSADDLAAVLTNTPEAIAAASAPGGKGVAVARANEDGTSSMAGGALPSAPSAPQETVIGVAAADH